MPWNETSEYQSLAGDESPVRESDWEAFDRALESVLRPGARAGTRDCDGLARFLDRTRALDVGLRAPFLRGHGSYRFRLRSEMYRRGIWERPGTGRTIQRGLLLAMEYGRLRLRESLALRVCGVFLLVHLLAVPVMAYFSRGHRSTPPGSSSYSVTMVHEGREIRFLPPEEMRGEDSGWEDETPADVERAERIDVEPPRELWMEDR